MTKSIKTKLFKILNDEPDRYTRIDQLLDYIESHEWQKHRNFREAFMWLQVKLKSKDDMLADISSIFKLYHEGERFNKKFQLKVFPDANSLFDWLYKNRNKQKYHDHSACKFDDCWLLMCRD